MVRHTRLLLLLPLLLMPGCGSGGDGGGGSGGGPIVTWARLEPSSLDGSGGRVTILANASSQVGITSVKATVVYPDGFSTVLDMTVAAGGHFEASFVAPPNPGASNQIYIVSVVATDSRGQTSQPASAGVLRVGAEVEPPPPPPL